MTVKEYIEFIKDNKDKVDTLKDTQYISCVKKKSICEKIVELTSERKINIGQDEEAERIVFISDSITRHILYVLNLINLYTKVDVDFKNAVSEYDLLMESETFGYLFGIIPEKEKNEFNIFLDLTIQDYSENYKSLTSWLDRKLEGNKLVLGTILEWIMQNKDSFSINPEGK